MDAPLKGFREEPALFDLLQSFTAVEILNTTVFLAFTLCYGYQLVYVVVVWLKKPPKREARAFHRFAVLVPARNESAVIADLLHSIRLQDYPAELVDTFVVADNCSDDTAEVARRNGAIVLERFNEALVGKGYALDYGYQAICENYADRGYEAFLVLDADNVLDAGYLRAMNASLDNGELVATSYRNSKNYATNWITAGYATWFLRESRFLNQARLALGTSCAVSGTGFFVAAEVLERSGGWDWHLLTEDIEFSAASIASGLRISYCPDAVLYDEQPETFRDSWNQRFRWAKGFYQVLGSYAVPLARGLAANPPGMRFACYDMLMTVAPAMLLTVFVVAVNFLVAALGLLGVVSAREAVEAALFAVGFALGLYLLSMFLFGVLSTVSEWRNIRAGALRKLWGMLTFPLFMATYIPIALAALVGKAEWKPIRHSVTVSVSEFAATPLEKPSSR